MEFMTLNNLQPQVIRNVHKETGNAYCITIKAMCTFVLHIYLNITER